MTFNLVSACPLQWNCETSTQVTLRPHLNCGGERIKTKLVRNQTSVTTQNSEELNLLQTGSIRVQLYLSSFPNNVNIESDLHALTKQLWTLCSFIRKEAQVNQQLRAPWKPWHLMRLEMRSSFSHLSAPDRESELENLIRLSSRRNKHMSSRGFHHKGRYLNWKALWNVSYSHSPLSHLLFYQNVWENPVP